MFAVIWKWLAKLPRWLMLVWGLAGPFFGMALRELLKDRAFGGLNDWLDKTFGQAVTSLANGVLLLVWMLAFGAILWLVYWVALQRHHALPKGQSNDDTSSTEATKQIKPYAPTFKMQFKEREKGVVGSKSDPVDPNFEILILELTNATDHYLGNVAVEVSGMSSSLRTLKPHKKTVETKHLSSRRDSSGINSGQKLDYVIISKRKTDNLMCIGDHTTTKDRAYSEFPYSSQLILTIRVFSQNSAPCEHRIVLITTGEGEILPVYPNPMNWIWNG